MQTVAIPDRVAYRAATRFRIIGECHISDYRPGSRGVSQIGWAEDGVQHTTSTARAAYRYFHRGKMPRYVEQHCHNGMCVRNEHLIGKDKPAWLPTT